MGVEKSGGMKGRIFFNLRSPLVSEVFPSPGLIRPLLRFLVQFCPSFFCLTNGLSSPTIFFFFPSHPQATLSTYSGCEGVVFCFYEDRTTFFFWDLSNPVVILFCTSSPFRRFPALTSLSSGGCEVSNARDFLFGRRFETDSAPPPPLSFSRDQTGLGLSDRPRPFLYLLS